MQTLDGRGFKAFLFVIMAAIIFLPFAARAGDFSLNTPEERAQKDMIILVKELDLTLDQQSQIKPMLLTHATQQDALKWEYLKKAKAEDQDSDAKITAVLSDAQKAKFLVLKESLNKPVSNDKPAEDQPHHGGRMGGGMHGGQ